MQDCFLGWGQVVKSVECCILLYILTSVWGLLTPNAGQNIQHSTVFFKKIEYQAFVCWRHLLFFHGVQGTQLRKNILKLKTKSR